MVGYYPINPAGSSEDPFGPRFFKTRFYQWIKEACSIDNKTPVLEIMLTSGQVLDVSHIEDLRDEYMLACVFSDIRDCSQTYHTYLRYQTIFRINVLTQPRDERPLGFNTRHQPLIMENGKAPSLDLEEIMAKRKATEGRTKAQVTASKAAPKRKK